MEVDEVDTLTLSRDEAMNKIDDFEEQDDVRYVWSGESMDEEKMKERSETLHWMKKNVDENYYKKLDRLFS